MVGVSRFALLFMACLAGPAGLARAECQLNKIAGLHAVRLGNAIYAPVTINGREVLFQVDTGAPQSWLLHAGADALGLKVTLTTGGRLHDEIHFMTAPVESAAIGSWSKKDFTISVKDGPVNPILPNVVGVLGLDVLRGFDVEINMKDAAINFFVPQGCEQSNLAYWSESYNTVDMLQLPGERKGAIHAPFVLAKVNGQNMLAVFLSTITYSALYTASAERVGVRPDSPGVVKAAEIKLAEGQTTPVWRGTFESFSLDQEEIKPAVLSFNERIEHGPGGPIVVTHTPRGLAAFDLILGGDFISAHRILFSNSQQRIYFTYAGGPPFYKIEGKVPEQEGPQAVN